MLTVVLTFVLTVVLTVVLTWIRVAGVAALHFQQHAAREPVGRRDSAQNPR